MKCTVGCLTIIGFFVILFHVIKFLISFIPFGYEDEDGFHYGEK